MNSPQIAGPIYTCPMHSDVIKTRPGKCPYCGMALIPEGSRFGMLRHIMSSPIHAVVLVAAMVALIAAAMMLWRWRAAGVPDERRA